MLVGLGDPGIDRGEAFLRKQATGLHEAGVGFVVSTVAFVVVSLLTRPPQDADRLLEAMEPDA